MNRLTDRKNSSEPDAFLSVFLFCLLVSFCVVFIFQYFYFPVRYAQMRTAEMENVFGEEELFAENSRSILNTRSDVGYVRLLDRNGVLEKSFGVQDDSGFEKLTVKGPEGKAVLVGIKMPSGNGNYLNMALWSLLAGSLMAVALSFFLRAMNARSLRFLGNFSDAMRRLSRGDYSARLEPGSSFAANPGLARLCREFNDMASSISPAPPGEKASDEDSAADAGESAVPADAKDAEETAGEDSAGQGGEPRSSFRPKIVPREQEQAPLAETPPGSGVAEILSGRTAEADGPPAVSDDRGSPGNGTGVAVLVVKIADFDTFVSDLDPSEVDFITAEYRKSLSDFVVSFGGVVETVLRDEVVAFFSDSGDGGRKAAELRSVCCAVEIMQFFGAAEDRGATAAVKSRTKVKAGISSAELPVRAESEIFAEAKPFASEAKALCDGARGLNIFVSKDFRESVKDYLEVRRESLGGRLCYAVTGVEESALGPGRA